MHAAQAAELRAGLDESERGAEAERMANAALWEKLQAAGYKRYEIAAEAPDQAAAQPERAANAQGHPASRDSILQVQTLPRVSGRS